MRLLLGTVSACRGLRARFHCMGIHRFSAEERMRIESRAVVVATRNPLFTLSFRNILRRIGIETEPITTSGLRLLDTVVVNQRCLVLMDADCPLTLVSFGQLVEAAPDALFVIC